MNEACGFDCDHDKETMSNEDIELRQFDDYLVGSLTVFCSVIGLALFTAFMTGGLNPIGAAFIGTLMVGMGLVCLARFTVGDES